MSVQATSWVWNCSKTTGTAKMVLLAIADHAWPDGTNAWPSVSRLAKMTGLSEATVRRGVQRAEELGELAVERKSGGRVAKGQHASNDYVLNMDGHQPSQPATPNPVSVRPLTPSACDPNHKVTKKEPYSQEANAVCRKWWDSCDPKPMPAGGFVAARKIVAKALAAGWAADELDAALPMVETLAFWSLEKALKQNRQQAPARKDKSWWDK